MYRMRLSGPEAQYAMRHLRRLAGRREAQVNLRLADPAWCVQIEQLVEKLVAGARERWA
jgi:hypothetical protein